MKESRRFLWLTVCLLYCWVLKLSAQPQCHITRYDEETGMAQWYVTQIVQDREGMMWFSTWNGLNRFDGYEFQCFKSQVGDGLDIPSDRIQDLVLDDDGNLLCKIEERVLRFNVSNCKFENLSPKEEKAKLAIFQRRNAPDKGASASTPFLYQDPSGTKWSVSRDGQVCYQQGNEWIAVPSDIGHHAYLYFGTTDKQGNIWMRSDDAVYKLTFSHQEWCHLADEKPMNARAFFTDRHQRYWVSSKDGATLRLFDKDNRLLGYMGPDGMLHGQYTSFGSPVYHMLQDSQGVFWLCTKPGGLLRLREKGNGLFSVERFMHDEADCETLSSNDVYYATEDSKGRLWIATFDGGLNCIEEPHTAHPVFLHSDNGLKGLKDIARRVRQIHITSRGILLAATTTGLLVADVSQSDVRRTSFRLHTRHADLPASLSNNAVMYVFEDSHGRLFICTETGGMDLILSDSLLGNQLEFRHYNTSTGFPTDVTESAIEADGHIIVVSNNQLVKFDPEDHKFFSFDAGFWKRMLRFSEAAPARLPDGRLIFGLQDGALTVLPEKLCKSSYIPPIALTSIDVHNWKTDLAVNHLDTLLLATSDERDVTIHFSALDYSGGGVIKYAYQIEDDGPWQLIGKEHSATFLNLSPGTYQLKIRSTNSEGVWVENTRILTIIVKPTFMETNTAKALFILLLALVVWGVVYTYYYIKRIKRQQRETHEAYLALLNRIEEPSPGTQEKPRLKPEDEAFMQRAMKFIEDHIGDLDVNIGDMAEATATSRSGLNRKMKSILGVTPLDFIREARIRKACAMLSQGAMVKDVAYACGFSDVIYFRKCFKAEIGKAPSEYRDENFGK